MKHFIYLLIVTSIFNVILFVTCALPWYGVIVVSNWYLLLAIPLTCIGGIVCNYILQDLYDTWEDIYDDYFPDMD